MKKSFLKLQIKTFIYYFYFLGVKHVNRFRNVFWRLPPGKKALVTGTVRFPVILDYANDAWLSCLWDRQLVGSLGCSSENPCLNLALMLDTWMPLSMLQSSCCGLKFLGNLCEKTGALIKIFLRSEGDLLQTKPTWFEIVLERKNKCYLHNVS